MKTKKITFSTIGLMEYVSDKIGHNILYTDEALDFIMQTPYIDIVVPDTSDDNDTKWSYNSEIINNNSDNKLISLIGNIIKDKEIFEDNSDINKITFYNFITNSKAYKKLEEEIDDNYDEIETYIEETYCDSDEYLADIEYSETAKEDNKHLIMLLALNEFFQLFKTDEHCIAFNSTVARYQFMEALAKSNTHKQQLISDYTYSDSINNCGFSDLSNIVNKSMYINTLNGDLNEINIMQTITFIEACYGISEYYRLKNKNDSKELSELSNDDINKYNLKNRYLKLKYSLSNTSKGFDKELLTHYKRYNTAYSKLTIRMALETLINLLQTN